MMLFFLPRASFGVTPKEQLCIRNNIHLKQFASFVYFYNFVQLKFT